MIAVIDYGVGNLFSLASSLQMLKKEVIITGDAAELASADHLILPGVGAFKDAADKLRDSGLDEVVKKEAAKGKPILGICLGMQMLLEKSYEYGEHQGLGLIRGNVKPIRDVIDPDLKIPHIGWNSLHFTKENELFKYIKEGDFVYFVHSFYGADCEESTIATAEYSVPLTAAVAHENVYGCQFHPEKSGEVGMKILQAFCEIGGES